MQYNENVYMQRGDLREKRAITIPTEVDSEVKWIARISPDYMLLQSSPSKLVFTNTTSALMH